MIVQYYVELEAGGSEAFQKLIKDGLYSPYIWEVRHFKEGEVNESEIRFTPSGEPYGYSEWLSEDAPGASLTQDEALKVAKTHAENFWNINLREYELIDKSQKVRPSGRIDHTFVYERPHIRIGEGRYRLSLEISGDKLTELYHYIEIPEEFLLKYKEMRSANDTIADVASYVMYLLYVLVGGCFGIFYLLRKRWIIWKVPLYWGIFVAILQSLSAVNEWPGDWMYYDTALSTQVFILEKVADLVQGFLFDAFLLTISFMAAESLTRKAFPNHIQLWRVFSPQVANSVQILGRTVSGYLLVGLDFAFLIGLYFFSTRVLGWWTPSDVLIDPDILATYQPWFSPIAESIKAGFWEESLCRAIPIAGAALIGQKMGHRRVWIAGALLFQAILFGALHTNYAGQPSYARLVELIIPSLVYGLIYLRFGLLPCMILHFAYDAVLMALPLFISSASGIWVDRILVIALVLTPLWLIAYRWFSNGKLGDLKEAYYNKLWLPSEKRPIQFEKHSFSESHVISPKTIKWISIGGCIGLFFWISTTNFQSDSPPISITRNQAKIIATNALKDQGISFSDSWEILSTVRIFEDEEDQFIWQEGGKDTYKKLLGNYLFPPVWMVRFAKFEGSITQRAEQYYVYICGDGEVYFIRHKIPESKPGEYLNEDQAREIAYSVVREKYNLDPAALKEISVESSKRPSRRDWKFIFSDPQNYPLKKGEARIRIKIAGQEVLSSYRYVHVPENWSRENQNRETLIEIIEDFGFNLKLAISLIIMATAIWYWSRKKFSVQAFFLTFAILFSVDLIGIVNDWPSINAEFSTAEPVSNQILSKISSSFFVLVLYPIVYSLYVGLVQGWKRPHVKISTTKALVIGSAIGVMIEGFSSFITYFLPSIRTHMGRV